MKNNFLPLASALFALLIATNCTKQNNSVDNEFSTQRIQTAIVGSWQFVEKGLDVAMHDGHICPNPQNMAQDKITYVVQWQKAASDEKRNFMQNGNYNSYVESALACQGTYKVSDIGILEMNTNCEQVIGKIEQLPSDFLVIKQGSHYFKYHKLD